MKINKKLITCILLIVFIVFITPIFTKTSSISIALTGDEGAGVEGDGYIPESMKTDTTDSHDPIENPGYFNPGEEITDPGATALAQKAAPIFNAIFVIGIIISVIVLIILGIKYMIGSVEERADYKRTMVPYIVGAIMLVSITSILKLFISLVTNLKFW